MNMQRALELFREIWRAKGDSTTPVGACDALNFLFRCRRRMWRRGNAVATVGVKDGKIVLFVNGDENAKESIDRFGLPDVPFPVVCEFGKA